MNDKSKTPETDEAADYLVVGTLGGKRVEVVKADFARKLEIERDAARENWRISSVCRQLVIERDNAISDAKQSDIDSIRALHERNEAREELERYRDLIGEVEHKNGIRGEPQ